jgi:predicted nuclease with TOPRIM domain
MENISEINQASEQPNESNRIQDMFKILLEKMAESNQNMERNMSEMKADNQNVRINLQSLQKTMSEMRADNENLQKNMSEMNQKMSEMKVDHQNLQINLERKISETNQEVVAIKKQFREFNSNFEFKVEQIIDNVTRVIDEKISSEVTSVEVKLNDKFEKPADEEEEVKDMAQKVQVETENCKEENERIDPKLKDKIEDYSKELNEKCENLADDMDEKCTEENLKRQGERTAQLKSKSKDVQNEVLEGLNMIQVKEITFIQDTSASTQISPIQTDYGIINVGTNKKTRDYKCICPFRKYAYSFRTVIIDITGYERDRVVNNDKVKRSKKCKRLEWCINVKKRKMLEYVTEKKNYVIVLRYLNM